MRINLICLFLAILSVKCSSKKQDDGGSQKHDKPTRNLQKKLKKDSTELLNWPTTLNADAFLKKYGEDNPETEIVLKTRLGDIKIKLFEDTPLHRANFIFNVKRKLYEKTIFYRVVPEFMVQGGNSDFDKTLEARSKNAAYYIPNEVKTNHLHKKGAIAMAMTYTDNPELKSAQYSYYIVIGKPMTDEGLTATEKEYKINIAQENRETYKSIGGTPHLDGVHTVFGEVIEGMDVVEAISKEKTDTGDWPINDVIISCSVIQ